MLILPSSDKIKDKNRSLRRGPRFSEMIKMNVVLVFSDAALGGLDGKTTFSDVFYELMDR